MRRYYLSNAARAHNGETAINEFAMDAAPDAADSTSRAVAALTEELSFSWITADGEPFSYSWPTADYRCQLDVTAAGADLTYGFSDLVVLGVAGSFQMCDSAHVIKESNPGDTGFSGTGLKMATYPGPWVAAPARSDVFAAVLAVRNANALNPQTITLRFGVNAYAEGPWLSKQAYSPMMLLGVGY